jgi:Tfp pilus assembly protein PilW
MFGHSSSRTTSTERASGFTVVEALVAVTVGGLLLAAVVPYYLAQQGKFRTTRIEIESSESLRAALDQIVHDLRSAGSNPTADGSAPGLTYAAAEEIQFSSDLNGDGDVADDDEVRGFRKNGTNLEMMSAGTVATYATLAAWMKPAAVETPTFRYYRWDGTEVTTLPASEDDLSTIKRIDVMLTVQRTIPTGREPYVLTRTRYETVTLRNFDY